MNPSTTLQGCSTDAMMRESLSATALLFDLDGTLVDSAPDIASAVNQVLDNLGLPPVTVEETRHWIGSGLRYFFREALAQDTRDVLDPAFVEYAYSLFESRYAESVWSQSVCYPGVVNGLSQLEAVGFKMACVTNKPRSCTVLLLDQAGLAHYFDVVVAGDDLIERKPAPAPLLYAANVLGATPSECVVIGDSRNDVEAAKAAGMAVLVLTSGYNQGADLTEMGATRLVTDFSQIFELVIRA